MSIPLEFALKPHPDNLPGKALPDHPFSHGEDIGVVVFSGSPGREDVMAQSCPNAPNLVCGNSHPHPGSTDENPPVAFPPGNVLCHPEGHIRVIIGFLLVHAVILNLMPQGLDVRLEVLL